MSTEQQSMLDPLETLKQELAEEKRMRKGDQKEALRLNRQHFAYRDIQAIYSRLKYDAERDAQLPIDDHYREALSVARALYDALVNIESALDGAAEYGFSEELENTRKVLKDAADWGGGALRVVEPYGFGRAEEETYAEEVP